MLRRMILKNFVHFGEKQVLDFTHSENEPILFVGASSTGKTAALELIRRCLESKLNSSLTSRTNPESIAYVFCEFKTDLTFCKDTVITGLLVDGKHGRHSDGADQKVREEEKLENTNDEKAGTNNDEKVHEESYEKEKDADTIFYRITIYSSEGKNHALYEKFSLKTADEIVPDNKIRKLQELPSILCLKLDEMITSSELNDEKVSEMSSKFKIKNETVIENNDILKELSRTYVGILSMRGIGTFQWTKSKQISVEYREDNYKNTCTQAEIISDLINSDSIKKDKEERIFRYLIGGDDIVFEKGDDNKISVMHGKNKFPLLKTSVGVLEAKQFSLLMAHKDLKTICFEEPDRGMHPQMIQCMKVVLHEESRNKTIIVVTHSPYLVDSLWFQNTYYFHKKGIFPMKEYGDPVSDKNAKFPAGAEDFKILLFSTRVLLVEGKTDKLILQGIFRHRFTTLAEKENIDKHRNISEYQIFSCGGKDAMESVASFCRLMKITHLELLDRDCEIEMDNRGWIWKINDKNFEGYLDKPISDFLENAFNSYSDILKENGKFIWKAGDLEDMLLSERKHQEEICNILNIKNDKQRGRKSLKKAIKDTLSNGLSKTQLEKLSDILVKFDEVVRLLDFLGHRSSNKTEKFEK
ncbi:uncharacterized protein LOC144617478 [Crassostrea virginica]